MADLEVSVQSGEKNTDPDTATRSGLIVFVRGLHWWFPKEAVYEPIKTLLLNQLPGFQLYMFDYKGTSWSREDPTEVARLLEQNIAREVERRGSTTIYLVGHSFGALLLRQAILYNAGKGRTAPWLERVNRLVLLGGANRGFLAYDRLSSVWAWLIINIQPAGMGRLAAQGLRGSVWVTALRLEWRKKSVAKDGMLPPTIQLRGAKDRIVGPHDSVDITFSRNSHEITIDAVGHTDIALLNAKRVEEVKKALQPKISEALFGAIPAKPPSAGVKPDHVVFLIHGIRDFAEWHEDLGETITQEGKSLNKIVEVVPISYGYFSALQFLFLTARRRCARAFLDKYVQYYSRYPEAQFSAVAHSNGTYALTWAIENNQFVRLENIFLAGCVRPIAFPWEKFQGQIAKVRNDCTNKDWPVAVLCWWLSWVPFYRTHLGTGGVDGFKERAVDVKSDDEMRVINNKYREGDHSSALDPKYHQEIAKFILVGKPWRADELSNNDRSFRRWVIRAIALTMVVGIVILFWCIIPGLGWTPRNTTALTMATTLILVIFLLLL